MNAGSGPSTAQLADEARAALQEVTDPSARATVLCALAAITELQALSRCTQGIEARLKQLNRYLGAMANKP
ncbi:hypothetical protein ACWCQL_31400 [Streptomyces sp. NPDC002073]|uniref:hypothetical protein n=1 Tax=Streptomyces sp. NBC_00239 TaxID=2903640 RepID=UPI002E28B901|nr:hypothetical protein [Streptomyces sp. NBC_00239]